MKIKKGQLVVFVLIIASPLSAAKLELTPFAGIRFGGSFQNAETGESIRVNSDASYGGAISFKLPALFDWLELHASRQRADLLSNTLTDPLSVQIDYVQGGILREFDVEAFRPFLAGYLGMTQMDFSSTSTDHRFFSVGAGGGFKYFMRDWLALRSEVRVYATLTEGSTAVRCRGGCVVNFSGSGFWQGELAQSVVIKF